MIYLALLVPLIFHQLGMTQTTTTQRDNPPASTASTPEGPGTTAFIPIVLAANKRKLVENLGDKYSGSWPVYENGRIVRYVLALTAPADIDPYIKDNARLEIVFKKNSHNSLVKLSKSIMDKVVDSKTGMITHFSHGQYIIDEPENKVVIHAGETVTVQQAKNWLSQNGFDMSAINVIPHPLPVRLY